MGGRYDFAVSLVVALMLGLALSHSVTAQDPGRDHYQARASRDGAQMLRNLDQNHYRLALGALQRQRYVAALADLEFMLKYVPNHPQALAAISHVAIGLNRRDLAERHFTSAIQRYPQHDETYVIYGVFLHKLGRTDAAIAQYRKALEINPNSGFGHYNLGLAYVDTKDYAQANVHAQKAYQLGIDLPGLKRQLEAVRAWEPSKASNNKLESQGTAEREGGVR